MNVIKFNEENIIPFSFQNKFIENQVFSKASLYTRYISMTMDYQTARQLLLPLLVLCNV